LAFLLHHVRVPEHLKRVSFIAPENDVAIICHCEAVRDTTIVEAITAGACSVDDVRAVCGAATSCGGCVSAVETLVDLHGGGTTDELSKVLAHAR
jgi:nitrite reductase (NADH) large subunit